MSASNETQLTPDDRDLVLDLHRRMVRIRVFETEAGKLMEASELPGFLHLYVGQEAVAAGAMSRLSDTDQITSTHRGHGHALAKGARFKPMFAELFGKIDGYGKGRGGSMHINDLEVGMLGANGIVGGGLPIATGAAFASAYRGDGDIAVAFFGDGTSNIGAFHEAASIATVLDLPIIFLCENNGYAEFTPAAKHMRAENVADRAVSYGMPAIRCNGMDALDVNRAMAEAVEITRRGDGPVLLEAETYRYFDHQGVKGLRKPYRTQEEIDEWKEKDAMQLIERQATAAGIVTQAEFDAVWDEVRIEAAEAIEYARNSAEPDPADLLLNVYAD